MLSCRHECPVVVPRVVECLVVCWLSRGRRVCRVASCVSRCLSRCVAICRRSVLCVLSWRGGIVVGIVVGGEGVVVFLSWPVWSCREVSVVILRGLVGRLSCFVLCFVLFVVVLVVLESVSFRPRCPRCVASCLSCRVSGRGVENMEAASW